MLKYLIYAHSYGDHLGFDLGKQSMPESSPRIQESAHVDLIEGSRPLPLLGLFLPPGFLF